MQISYPWILIWKFLKSVVRNLKVIFSLFLLWITSHLNFVGIKWSMPGSTCMIFSDVGVNMDKTK